MTEGLRRIFQSILEMGITGSMVIGVVLMLRVLFRRIPKKFICLLWLAACFRLICPVAAEGPVPDLWSAHGEQAEGGGLWSGADGQGTGVFPPGAQGAYQTGPEGQGISPWLAGGAYDGFLFSESGYPSMEGGNGGIQDGNGGANNGNHNLSAGAESGQEEEAGFFTLAAAFLSLTAAEKIFWAGCFIWLAGAGAFALYGILHYTGLYRRLKTAVKGKDGLYETACVQTPMVFGFLRPRIYLPPGFRKQVSGREYALILRHEQMHIRRRDYLLMAAAYGILCIHWYNPLVWLSVFFIRKDMEMACDEAVIKEAKEDIRQVYAEALLHFSMRRSGLLSYAAFGESNTESRIKNILKYKKQPLLISAGIFAVILTVFVCLVTRPHAVEGGPEQDKGANPVTDGREEGDDGQNGKTEEGEVEYLADGTIVYGSLEQMKDIYRARWEAALTEQGRLQKDSVLKYYDSYYSTETDEKPMDQEAEFVYYALQEDARIILYKTSVVYRMQDSRIYVSSETDKIYENVTTAEDARKQGVIGYYRYRIEESGTVNRESPWQPLEEAAMLSSSGYYRELLEPETAVSFLMRLEGGTGKKLGSTEGGVYVTYTFSDGSSAVYLMHKQDAGFWFPEKILGAEEAAYKTLVSKVLEEAGPELLAQVTADWKQSPSILEPLGPDPKAEAAFVLLSRTEDEEAALYGLKGGIGMALVTGGKAYPLLMEWTSPQMVMPEIYGGDYDGDQSREYALYTHMGTGTAYSVSQLYMLEISGSEMEAREFSQEAVISQLGRITARWDQEYSTADLLADGEYTGQTLYLGQFLKDMEEEYQAVCWGNFIDFSERDGQWYLWARGGIQLTDTWIEYACSAEATAPVAYGADGSFTLGEITLKANEYKKAEASGEEAPARGEKVIYAAYADVTHDGTEDAIVTSVSWDREAGLNTEGMTPEEILNTYAASCRIRVYDGAMGDSVRENVQIPLDMSYVESLDSASVIWEKELTQAHVGNGMVFLSSREGRDYLVDVTAWAGQGAGSYGYQVFSLDTEKRIYKKEEGQVTFDTNTFAVQEDPEKAFSVPDMVEYTEKLSAWTDGALLLIRTDVDEEPRITKPEEKASMEAWEIWKPLLNSQEIPLTGSKGLEQALTLYREAVLQNPS